MTSTAKGRKVAKERPSADTLPIYEIGPDNKLTKTEDRIPVTAFRKLPSRPDA